MNNKKPTVFIYARRSSEKNRDTSISIDKQLEELMEICEKKWFEIIWSFQDNKSAYTEWKRDQFSNMLDEVRKRNIKGIWKKVDYIYVYFISRLSRNFEEGNEITQLVLDDKIKVLSKKERMIDCGSLDWKKTFVELLNEAMFDSKEKSLESIINMDQTYKKWRIAGNMPYGYISIGKKDNNFVAFDNNHDAAKVVKECFELYSTGKYTYDSITDEFKKRWYKRYTIKKWEEILYDFDRHEIERILCNEFYWWRVVVKYKKLTTEKIEYLLEKYPELKIEKGNFAFVEYTELLDQLGAYPKLIDKRLFDACKDVREWNTVWSRGKWLDDGEIYVWKWITQCSCQNKEHPELYKTLRFYTAETKKKKVQRYQYYRCSCNDKTLCDKTSISGTRLEDMIFDKVISKLKLNAFDLKMLEKVIQFELEKQWKLQEDTKHKLNQELGRLESEKELYVKRYGKETDDDMIEELGIAIKKIKREIEEIKNRLNNFDDVAEYNKEQIEEPLKYAKELATGFKNFSPRKKQHIAASIFNSIVIQNKEIIYFDLKPLFKGIYKRGVLIDPEKTDISIMEGSNSKNKKKKPLLTSSSDIDLYGGGWGIRTLAAPCGTLQV